jgi:two-component system, NtrC family, response regulator
VAKILIIDDDKTMCGILAEMAVNMGYSARTTQCLSDGIRVMDTDECEVVFLDVMMPDGNGLEAILTIKQKSASPEIIIITGDGDEDGAELAINNGAWDYIQKTSSIKDMRLSLKRALQYWI